MKICFKDWSQSSIQSKHDCVQMSIQDVENLLDRKEITKLRKKEVLHKKWNERVYKPLRKKILEAMDGNDWIDVDRRKRELHKQYLEFTNAKVTSYLGTL